MAIEREIKYTVPRREIFSQIAALPDIGGYLLRDRGIRCQVDTCYDTCDLQLYHGKSVLRIRRWGDQAIMTYKSHGGTVDGVYQRSEIESPVPFLAEGVVCADDDLPDCGALRAFRREWGEAALLPGLTVANDRRIIDLERDGVPIYELVLDDVMFRGPEGGAQVLELEIEACTDHDSDLRNLGELLAERYGLVVAGPSKYILGMRLVGGAG